MTRHEQEFREQEFRFLGHRVVVPQSILKGWAAVPNDKVCRIIDSVWVVYAEQNLKWESARVGPEVVAEELATGEQAPTALQLYHDFRKDQRSNRKKLTNAEVKERVLEALRFHAHRDWNRSPIAAAFRYALRLADAKGDQHFLKALGKRLGEKPIPCVPPRAFPPLASLLLEHWVAEKGICLCWFSNNALVAFLGQIGKSYMPDTTRKAYVRLGLRKLRRPLVLGSQVVGKQIIRLRGSGTN